MKNFTCLIFLVLFAFGLKAENNVNLIDSVYNFNYTGNNWVKGSYKVYNYGGNLLSNITEYYDKNDSIGLFSSKMIYTYSESGKLSEELYLIYDKERSEPWVNSTKKTYEYDDIYNTMTYYSYSWNKDKVPFKWKLNEKRINTYNNKYLIVRYVIMKEVNDSLIYNYYEDICYDQYNNYDTLTSYNWKNGRWNLFSIYYNDKTYDSENHLTEMKWRYYSKLDSQWHFEGKIVMIYENGNLIDRAQYYVDFNDTSIWLKDSRTCYTYNSDNLVESKISQSAKEDEWINNSKEIYIYKKVNTINESTVAVANLNISPNPATDYIEISVPDDMNQRFKSLVQNVRIYNVFGQEVLDNSQLSIVNSQLDSTPFNSPASGGHSRLDVSMLPPGVYFVRVGEKVGKFVKS